jgi:drug/metabolite transporter (DMT)-like permease
MGMALALAPFTKSTSLLAVPLVGAAMEEGSAAFFMFWYSLFTGRIMEYGRAICTKGAWLVLCGALSGGPLAMSFYLVGINWCGAAYALSITGLYPAVSAIVGYFWHKEKIGPRAWVGIFMSVVGGILVGFAPPSGHFPHFFAGLMLSLVAGVGWGMEGNFAAFASDMIDPDMVTSLREAASFFVYLFAILPLVGGYILFGQAMMTPQVLWIMFGAGVAGAVSYITYYRCCNLTGAGRGGALNMTYAMFGILFAWLLANSPMTITLYIGCGVTTVGAILISANPRELFQLRAKKGEVHNA